MGTLSKGEIVYYSPDDGDLGTLIDKVIKSHLRSESVVCFRPKPGWKIEHKDMAPNKKIRMQKHNVKKIFRGTGADRKVVPGIVKISVTSQANVITYEEFQNQPNEEIDWKEGMERMANGDVGSFHYGINIMDKEYVDNLKFTGMFDIRKFGGVLDRYYNLEDIQRNPKDYQGTMIPTLYVGNPGDAFVFHVEDAYFSSLNAASEGKKLWLFVANREGAVPAHDIIADFAGAKCPHPKDRKAFFCTAQKLLDRGINLKYIVQEEGDIMFTLPMGPHMGLSLTKTMGIARNCADAVDWVAVALHYAKEHRRCVGNNCPEDKMSHLSDLEPLKIVQHLISPYDYEQYQLGIGALFPLKFSGEFDFSLVVTPPKQLVCTECQTQYKTYRSLLRHQRNYPKGGCKVRSWRYHRTLEDPRQ